MFSFKSKPLVGLDISSSAVKLLQLERVGDRYRVEKFGMEALPGGTVVEKNIEDIDAVSNAIRSVVQRSGCKVKDCAVAVSGSAVFTKIISLPADLAAADVESHVEIEAAQYIPYPLDEVSRDFEVLGPSPRSADMVDILLAASKQDNVENLQDAVEAAGMNVKVVDVEAFATANAFGIIRAREGLGPEAKVGIMDVGAQMASLLVLHGERMVYSRETAFGSQQLVNDIAARYEMAPEQASAALQGLDNLPEDFHEEVLQPFQFATVQQISRALQFYSSSNEYESLDAIYLAGGPAKLPGMAQLVEDELGLNAKVADPIDGLGTAADVARTRLQQIAPSMMVATGLAMRGLES